MEIVNFKLKRSNDVSAFKFAVHVVIECLADINYSFLIFTDGATGASCHQRSAIYTFFLNDRGQE